MEQYAWFIWSLGFLALWLVLYVAKASLRKQMLRVSLWTAPLGLTEPLFVPEYWNPPSLLDLAQRTGFDLESLIFCFAISGLFIWHIPLEEYLFAFTFGIMWSSLYEHVLWQKIVPVNP